MRTLPALLVLAGFLTACQSNPPASDPSTNKTDSMNSAANSAPADNTLTEEEKQNGWQLLFDGSTKNGWHIFKNSSDGAAWMVSDGTLHLDSSNKKDGRVVGGGDIITDSAFDNFHLKLEWKVDSGGNSGVIFYVKEDPSYDATWHTGPEMQVLDDAAHRDASIEKHRAGDLYDLIAGTPGKVNPAGQWNLVEIIADKGRLTFIVNGTETLTTTLWDDNWKKLVAGSKFRINKDFGLFKSGKIALQDHGDPVWYRNIKIRKL
ncbi:MAG: DUF1080 domain-containing protein [Candidatus Pseudobacter hemicellulosilyticus]|uniref:DUF1080 domain-containing protein n=1 Tax=Candidatus Pseudobacter hemicellulosilyticus TaxID=3121375 RepID=A0AAJ5WYT6_9BACT|nr:MAG: DUF1080 domain-containing protein [Pseudobacter sp.]